MKYKLLLPFCIIFINGCSTYYPPTQITKESVKTVTCEESFYQLKEGMSIDEVEDLVGGITVISRFSVCEMAKSKPGGTFLKSKMGVFKFDQSCHLVKWESNICPERE